MSYKKGQLIKLISVDGEDKAQGLRVGSIGRVLEDTMGCPIAEWNNGFRWCVTSRQCRPLKAKVVAKPAYNSQSVTALDVLRKDIILAGLPYSQSWADRVNEVIQRLNAGVPALHT